MLIPWMVCGSDGEREWTLNRQYFPVDGACHQWRKVPPRELSVDLVADERLVWATGRVEAS